MKKFAWWRATFICLGVVLAVFAVVVAVIYLRPLTSGHVVGSWQAEAGSTGTAQFNSDGTFTVEGMSFNAIEERTESFGTFSGSGVWSISGSGAQNHTIGLRFITYRSSSDPFPVNNAYEKVTLYTTMRGWDRALLFSDVESLQTLTMTKVPDGSR